MLIGKDKVEMSFLEDDTILYLQLIKSFNKRFLQLVATFNNVAGYNKTKHSYTVIINY